MTSELQAAIRSDPEVRNVWPGIGLARYVGSLAHGTAGEVNVVRHDAPQLKEIKAGRWSLPRVQAEANRLCGLLDDAFVNSTLPDRPDRAKAEALLIDILRRHYETPLGHEG